MFFGTILLNLLLIILFRRVHARSNIKIRSVFLIRFFNSPDSCLSAFNSSFRLDRIRNRTIHLQVTLLNQIHMNPDSSSCFLIQDTFRFIHFTFPLESNYFLTGRFFIRNQTSLTWTQKLFKKVYSPKIPTDILKLINHQNVTSQSFCCNQSCL